MTAREKVMPARPDWRDEAQYRHLLDVDRPGWAWEWLRRKPGYVKEERDAPAPEIDVSAASCTTILRCPPQRRGGSWGLCFRRRQPSFHALRQMAPGRGFSRASIWLSAGSWRCDPIFCICACNGWSAPDG
jgi:hypothetical protein